MKRLTMRNEEGTAFWTAPPCPGGGYRLNRDLDDIQRLDRLAAYEDTGLMPEEITTRKPGCVFYCNRRCNLEDDWCVEGPGCPYEMDAETAMRQLIPPPNGPLTLAELWEMGGEPYWHMGLQQDSPPLTGLSWTRTMLKISKIMGMV